MVSIKSKSETGMRRPHPKRFACPVRSHAHPLVKKLLALAEEQRASLVDIAERAGIAHVTICKWKYCHSPSVVTLEAALNVLGYELQIRPRDELPRGRPKKAAVEKVMEMVR